MDPEQRGYFATLSDYIHLNPVRARIVDLQGRLFDYAWSSYRWYAATAGRAVWFEPRRVLGELDLSDDVAGRRQYAQRMRERAVAALRPEAEQALAELRRGWCVGGPSFRERMLQMLEAAGARLGTGLEGDAGVRRSHGEAEATRILRRGLEALGLVASELPSLRKGDGRKLALGALIRERTAVPNEWIARELHLGHVSRVSRFAQRARCSPERLQQIEAALEK